MHETAKMRRLSATAAELCSAYEALIEAGYDKWGSELRALLDIIDAEIAWLRTDYGTLPLAPAGDAG